MIDQASIPTRGRKGEEIESQRLPSGRYRIASSSIKGRVYTVDLEEGRCTCKGSYLGKHYCRHLQEATRLAGIEKGVQPAWFASPEDGFSTFRVERRFDAWMGPVFVVVESRPAGFIDYDRQGREVISAERVASPLFASFGEAWWRRKELEGTA